MCQCSYVTFGTVDKILPFSHHFYSALCDATVHEDTVLGDDRSFLAADEHGKDDRDDWDTKTRDQISRLNMVFKILLRMELTLVTLCQRIYMLLNLATMYQL